MPSSQRKPPGPAEVGSRLHLLSLPYDVRYLIISHLFPSSSLKQMYLMAYRDGVHPMGRPDSLHMDIFLTCRQLRMEASDHLFNNYLFNIIGYKKHVMLHYKPINLLMERYAKQGSSIEFLDNGVLSSTACVSIFAKGGRVEAMLQARQRGVTRGLEEVEREAAELPELAIEPPGFFACYVDGLVGVLELLNTYTAGAVAVFSLLLLGVAIWISRQAS